MIAQPPYLPDLAPADFFLFRNIKQERAGLSLTPDTFEKSWEGVVVVV